MCCQVCASPKSTRRPVLTTHSSRCVLRNPVDSAGAVLFAFWGALNKTSPPPVPWRSVFLLRKRRLRGGTVPHSSCYRAGCAGTYVDRCAGAIVTRATFRPNARAFICWGERAGETVPRVSTESPELLGLIGVVFPKERTGWTHRKAERSAFLRKLTGEESAICRDSPRSRAREQLRISSGGNSTRKPVLASASDALGIESWP